MELFFLSCYAFETKECVVIIPEFWTWFLPSKKPLNRLLFIKRQTLFFFQWIINIPLEPGFPPTLTLTSIIWHWTLPYQDTRGFLPSVFLVGYVCMMCEAMCTYVTLHMCETQEESAEELVPPSTFTWAPGNDTQITRIWRGHFHLGATMMAPCNSFLQESWRCL